MEEPAENEAAEETIEQTVPRLPWSAVLRDSMTFFQKLPGGGMQVVFVPAVATPAGAVPLPPGFEIVFGAAGWRRFQAEVAADGEKIPFVPTATVLPHGVQRPGT